MRMLTASPAAAALLRDWLGGPAAPTLRDAQHDTEQATLPWLAQTVAVGQDVGAVRTDLPTELLIAIVLGMGQAMDIWLITQPPADADLADAVHTLIAMIRRAVAPG